MTVAEKNRKKIVDRAIANQRLEGLQVSQGARKISDNYIVGKASAKDAAAKIKARYGLE